MDIRAENTMAEEENADEHFEWCLWQAGILNAFKENNLKHIGEKTYVLIDDKGENNESNIKKGVNYKLISSFLNGKRDKDEKILKKLSEEGIVIVNTLTSNGNIGPNLVCIDEEKFSTMSLDDEHIHLLKDASLIEREYVESRVKKDETNQVPAGDITIWNPNKTKAMGLMFSNSAPTITIKSDNGMVGMGVLRRQYITKEFFEKLQKVMGGNITIDVVSSTMNKYPAVNEEGQRILEDASDDTRTYTLPEYINDVLEQLNIQNEKNGIETKFLCNYEKCYNIDDKNNPFYKTGEKTKFTDENGTEQETLGNTSIVFDPSNNLYEEHHEYYGR